MQNLDMILSLVGRAASTLAPLVPGGGPALAAAKALSEAFGSLKQANGGSAPPEAEAAHDALFKRVMAHADKTLGRLEGD